MKVSTSPFPSIQSEHHFHTESVLDHFPGPDGNKIQLENSVKKTSL